MVVVRGVNVYPSAIDAIVRATGCVAEYQAQISSNGPLTELNVQIEPRPDVPAIQHPELAERVRAEIARQLSLSPIVEVAGPGGLPRFETKARRFQDERTGAAAHR